MRRAPEPPSLEPPEIDDIADEIERAAVVVGEKSANSSALQPGVPRWTSEMNIARW
jgi:hypothetical protein